MLSGSVLTISLDNTVV